MVTQIIHIKDEIYVKPCARYARLRDWVPKYGYSIGVLWGLWGHFAPLLVSNASGSRPIQIYYYFFKRCKNYFYATLKKIILNKYDLFFYS